MDYLWIKELYKTYNHKSGPREIFTNFNLSVPKGEFLTLFGPNGCGKTTLLNIIAGLIGYDKGQVIFNDSGKKTKIGYIFQNYELSLFPWRTNLDNITFALEIKGIDRIKRKEIAREFLEKIGIDIPLYNYPYQISGGQKQLVAIARALVYEPDVLLMDEPFSALDYKNRIFLQDKLLEIWEKTKLTIIFVSHELEEAIYLADRTILLSPDSNTHIIKDISINLPRPRTQDLKENPDFFSIFQELSITFRKAITDVK